MRNLRDCLTKVWNSIIICSDFFSGWETSVNIQETKYFYSLKSRYCKTHISFNYNTAWVFSIKIFISKNFSKSLDSDWQRWAMTKILQKATWQNFFEITIRSCWNLSLMLFIGVCIINWPRNIFVFNIRTKKNCNKHYPFKTAFQITVKQKYLNIHMFKKHNFF